MKPHRIATIIIALVLAGCAHEAKVTVVKPHLVPGVPTARTDRLAQQNIRRALKEERSQPLVEEQKPAKPEDEANPALTAAAQMQIKNDSYT